MTVYSSQSEALAMTGAKEIGSLDLINKFNLFPYWPHMTWLEASNLVEFPEELISQGSYYSVGSNSNLVVSLRAGDLHNNPQRLRVRSLESTHSKIRELNRLDNWNKDLLYIIVGGSIVTGFNEDTRNLSIEAYQQTIYDRYPSLTEAFFPLIVDDKYIGQLFVTDEAYGIHTYQIFLFGAPFTQLSNASIRQENGDIDCAHWRDTQSATQHLNFFRKGVELGMNLLANPEFRMSIHQRISAEDMMSQWYPTLSLRMLGHLEVFDLYTHFKQKLTTQIVDSEKNVADMRAELLRLVTDLAQKKHIQKGMDTLTDELDVTKFTHPKIGSAHIIQVTDTDIYRLVVTTEDIMMTPSSDRENILDGEPLNLGKYKIRIDLTPASDGFMDIRFEALNGTREAYEGTCHHPHVFSNGDACFGDFSDAIMVCAESLDYESMIDVLIMFLEQAATDDCAGKYWPSWVSGYDEGTYYDSETYICSPGSDNRCGNCGEYHDDCCCD